MTLRSRVLYASFDAVPAPKGASVHILQTVRAIARVADVDLLTLPGTLPGSAPLPAGVEHLTFAPPGDNFLQRALEWGDHVAQRLLEAQYDAVHVRSIWEGTPALLLRPERRYQLVYEANGLPSVELKYHYPALATSHDLPTRLRQQERALLAGAQAVMTQSRTTRSYLRAQGAPSERLHVIPNGVDVERFEGADYQPRREGPWRALYLGTLAPWQGVGVLVEALAEAREHCPITLQVVGGGRKEWRKGLERRIERLGLADAVTLEGAVSPEAVPGLLAEADFCVAPLTVTERNTVQGCCPIKVLEYLAAGRPVVAARLPAVQELVTHEETALLYKPDRPRRLAEALVRLAREPALCAALARSGRERARTAYTWGQHNDSVVRMYERILA